MNSSDTGGERLQKIIAQAGITSRRDAEELIRDGQVTVNGKMAKLGDKATLGKDAIKVKGKLLHSATHKVYYLFYKPKNVIAMIADDEEGRPTIKDFIHRIKERVFTIGRMDFTGEGAILLTNDGEFVQRLQKSNDIIRRYHVKVDRNPTPEELARIARGGRIEGRSMQPFHVRVVENYHRNALIEVSFEGMGSLEVRQYFENKGFFPEKVARVGIGHLNAEHIPPGSYKRIESSSIEAMFVQPELTKKQIERLVKKSSARTRVVREDDETSSDRPARNDTDRAPRSDARPTRSETRAPRIDTRAPRSEARPTFGESRTPRSDARTSYSDTRAPRRESSRPAFGETRSPRIGARPARSEGRPSFGETRAPRGDARGTRGERSAFGETRAPRGGARPTRGGPKASISTRTSRPARGGSSKPSPRFK